MFDDFRIGEFVAGGCGGVQCVWQEITNISLTDPRHISETGSSIEPFDKDPGP